jgi:hypothetical protein
MNASTARSALDLTGITAVEVATFGGELSVVTGSDNPRMEATVYGNATWSVERVGSLLYLVGKKRGFFYMGNGVSFRLWLPDHLALKLANVNADIRVRGDMRSLAANVVHGGIEVRASNPSEVKLRAVHGRVVVHGVTGKLDIVTTPGDVRVVNSGGELHVTATPGNVRLEQVVLTPGRSHTVTTSPGNIEVIGIHAPSGLDLRGSTTGPPIIIELPDYDVRNKGYRLHVQRAGPNPAKLTLTAVGSLSVKE